VIQIYLLESKHDKKLSKKKRHQMVIFGLEALAMITIVALIRSVEEFARFYAFLNFFLRDFDFHHIFPSNSS
jgi:hypothetical protein